jgi:hypothetical protein
MRIWLKVAAFIVAVVVLIPVTGFVLQTRSPDQPA